MSTSIPLIEPKASEFEIGQVIPIAAAHFVHDIFSSFFPTLLPVIIQKLTLTLTQAGGLSAVMQIPALLNPLIGYLADRVNLRYFVILAPATTATLLGLIGYTPGYLPLALLLFGAGISTAVFHAPAPAFIGKAAGNRIGLGMSLFMAGGELAYTVGPLIAVGIYSAWQLEGFARLIVVGWATSLVLFFRLRGLTVGVEKSGSLRAMLPHFTSFFLPLAMINLFRNPLLESLSTFLPTYMNKTGASLFISGSTLSILELAATGGALVTGSISDRLGRKRILLATCLVSAIFMFIFLQVSGWLRTILLLCLGFTALSSTPVMLAMVQDRFPRNRAVANGLYMVIS
jgi:FSR family fosmidomycin resistance protein-like MFS transporter